MTVKDWELHVVAHSAGSILAAHALPHLANAGIPFMSFQLLAPAIRIDERSRLVLPMIVADSCSKPLIYVLSEERELADSVGPYGKSLLWLVANTFEDKRGTPLLGMVHFLNQTLDLTDIFSTMEAVDNALSTARAARSDAKDHGSFDNDVATMNSVLTQILGALPRQPFTERDLAF